VHEVVLRGRIPYRPRWTRAQRRLSLVKERVFVKEIEADASPLWGNHHSTHYLWAQQAPTLFPGTHAGISRMIRQIMGKRAIQGSLRSVKGT